MNYKYKKSTTIMCFVLCLFPCVSGCNIAGGGFVHYRPPKEIICDKPWVITIGYSVVPVDPKEKRGKLTERYKNITIHIRDSLNNNFLAVPMVIESVNPKIGMYMKADMNPISCSSGIEYVEYYIDSVFDRRSNSTKTYRIPVSKD
jgi:hypothetical protein